MSNVQERLKNGGLVLIDGATGTDIERRGVPMVEGAWCGTSAFTHPDDVRAVHLAHIEAGAEVIIANTYASSRHLLEAAGHGDVFEDTNRISVELALEARKQSGNNDVLVAGSMSTTAQGGPYPTVDVARSSFYAQAEILAAAGADLIVLEMMRDIELTEVCLEAALATELPVWLGISCVVTNDVAMMWNETDTVEAFLAHFKDAPVDVLAVMHTEVDFIDPCLDVVLEHWNGPIGVYAQTGIFEPPVWRFIDTISAADYATQCERWIERGVQVIGGCCGIGHEHIAELRPLISAAP